MEHTYRKWLEEQLGFVEVTPENSVFKTVEWHRYPFSEKSERLYEILTTVRTAGAFVAGSAAASLAMAQFPERDIDVFCLSDTYFPDVVRVFERLGYVQKTNTDTNIRMESPDGQWEVDLV